MSGDTVGQARAVRREILELADQFAEVARGALVRSLERATEHLIAHHARWFNELDDSDVVALRRSVADTIRRSATSIADELRDPDLWVAPSVLLERTDEHEEYVWDWASASENPFVAVLDYLSVVPSDVKRVSHTEMNPAPERELDSPMNRVWIHLSNGADQLDGVYREFGLQPSAVPDWGGGHYGLQPKTADELDPTGRLEKLWKRYVKLFEGFRKLEDRAVREALASSMPVGPASGPEGEALRRWRETDPGATE